MENIRQLLQKYLEGKISHNEMIELSDQLNDWQSKGAEKILWEDWEAEFASDGVPGRNLNSVLHQIHHRIRLKENKPASYFGSLWRNFQQVAAIVIIPLAIAFIVFSYSQASQLVVPEPYAEIQCPLGTRTRFHLPDGSTGYLNSGSSLKFPVSFQKERSVEVSGEVFFNIIQNEYPFQINTKNLTIEMQGHTLNVAANLNESTEDIVIQSGRATVYSKNGRQLALLSANEQLIFNIEKQALTTIQVDALKYSAWKEGKLVFRNEDMTQVARRLSRWYNAEVIWVDDPILSGYNLQATFIDEPLDEVLKLISHSSPFIYKEEKRSVNADGVYTKRRIKVQAHPSKMSLLK